MGMSGGDDSSVAALPSCRRRPCEVVGATMRLPCPENRWASWGRHLLLPSRTSWAAAVCESLGIRQ